MCSVNGENVHTNRMRPASAPAHVRAIDETSGRADKSISPKVKMANIVQTWVTQMESGLLFPDLTKTDLAFKSGFVTTTCTQFF